MCFLGASTFHPHCTPSQPRKCNTFIVFSYYWVSSFAQSLPKIRLGSWNLECWVGKGPTYDFWWCIEPPLLFSPIRKFNWLNYNISRKLGYYAFQPDFWCHIVNENQVITVYRLIANDGRTGREVIPTKPVLRLYKTIKTIFGQVKYLF